MSEPKLNIYQRMANVMRDVPRIHKDANMMGRFNYAGHDKLTEKLQPAYLKHGVVRTVTVFGSVRDDRNNLSLEVKVSWINIDEPHDSLEVISSGCAPAMKGQPDPKQDGIALSYAVKNAEFKNLCIYGDDTPDADRSEPYHPPKAYDNQAGYETGPIDGKAQREHNEREAKKKKQPSDEICAYVLGLIRTAESEGALADAKKEGNKAMNNGDLSKDHQASIRKAIIDKGPM